MRFLTLFVAFFVTVLYFHHTERPAPPFYVVSNAERAQNDSLIDLVNRRCDLIGSVEQKGKNGYFVLSHPTYVSYLVLEEAAPRVRFFSIEEFRNGQWLPVFRGEKRHPVQVIKIGKVLEGRIRINVVRAYKIPHIKRAALYAERIYEYE